jgi:cyclase
MLKTRIIPTLLWKDFGLVKGIGFDSWRRVGSVVPSIKVYNQRDVDELILLDITATKENKIPDMESIEEFSRECFVPLTVGGGIRQITHVQKLLRAGADKICLNSITYTNPELVTSSSQVHGAQCVVVSIDARKNGDSWECFSHNGQMPTGRDVANHAKEMEERGAGELLITSIERDGTMTGYDLELIAAVSSRVKIPVIASGGAGNYKHMIDAVKHAGASAVAASSIFHFTERTPKEAKKQMGKEGIPVRKNYEKAEDSQI